MPEIDGLTRTRRLAGMDSTLSKIRGKLPNRLSAPSPSTDDDGALYRLGVCAYVTVWCSCAYHLAS